MRETIVLVAFTLVYFIIGFIAWLQCIKIEEFKICVKEAEDNVIDALNKRAGLLKDLSLRINELTGRDYATLYKAGRMKHSFSVNALEHTMEQQKITSERIKQLLTKHPELSRLTEIQDMLGAIWEAGQAINDNILGYNAKTTDLNSVRNRFPANMFESEYEHTLITSTIA